MPSEVRISGSGGQGLILAGLVLAEACGREGKHCAQSQAYEPVSRGGWSRTDVIVAAEPIEYPLATELDTLLLLHPDGAAVSLSMLKPGGRVLADSEAAAALPAADITVISLPLGETARRLGYPRATNMVALGALVSLTGLCSVDSLHAAMVAHTAPRFHEPNREALEAGAKLPQKAG